MLTSQLYTLPSVYHRNGGRERSESQYAGRWTKSTHAKYAAAAAARPVPWIPAIRSIYHTGTTLLRSTVGCRLRRPSVAAGTGDRCRDHPPGRLCRASRIIRRRLDLLLFCLLVLLPGLRILRFYSGQWVSLYHHHYSMLSKCLYCFLLLLFLSCIRAIFLATPLDHYILHLFLLLYIFVSLKHFIWCLPTNVVENFSHCVILHVSPIPALLCRFPYSATKIKEGQNPKFRQYLCRAAAQSQYAPLFRQLEDRYKIKNNAADCCEISQGRLAIRSDWVSEKQSLV